VKLEVQIGVSAELIERLDSGRLVVFAERPLGTSKGGLVWREPMVSAAAETFDLVPGAALPLALYRELSAFEEFSLSEWLKHSPAQMVAEHLNVDPSMVPHWPGLRAGVMPE
jgi:hypothetical protein